MRRIVPAATARGIALLALWVVIAGADPADLPAGAIAALLGTWVSLRLSPPTTRRIRWLPLIELGARLLIQSIVAGWDVAQRAFDPRLPLNAGLIGFRTRLPAGPERAAFSTVMSLVPGTLPTGSAADGTLLVHCLDMAQPVAVGLARDEAALLRALGGSQGDV